MFWVDLKLWQPNSANDWNTIKQKEKAGGRTAANDEQELWTEWHNLEQREFPNSWHHGLSHCTTRFNKCTAEDPQNEWPARCTHITVPCNNNKIFKKKTQNKRIRKKMFRANGGWGWGVFKVCEWLYILKSKTTKLVTMVTDSYDKNKIHFNAYGGRQHCWFHQNDFPQHICFLFRKPKS